MSTYSRNALRKRKHKKQQRKDKRRKDKVDARSDRARSISNTGNSPLGTENRSFNRRETIHEHYYYDNYGWADREEVRHEGWLKCRLLHGQGYSLIVPDQLFVNNKGLQWIQPLAFNAVRLEQVGDERIVGTLGVDISCGHHIMVRFSKNDFVRAFSDGSQLFRCEIWGPEELHEYATGVAEFSTENIPYLRLYHHTTDEARGNILSSRHFRTGPYNIQGTTKRLRNVSYAYFTPLDRISTNGDLKRIAMAPAGVIQLRRDGFNPPPILGPGWEERYKNEILQLQVYPCDPSKREALVEVWVDSTVLAPQHVYRHAEGLAVYFEFPHAFIQRVGTAPKATVVFDERGYIQRQTSLKAFDYVVVGDCTTLAGLAAPYDEEDTTHIMKIQPMSEGQTLLDYWFENSNQDLYSGLEVELQEFASPEDDK